MPKKKKQKTSTATSSVAIQVSRTETVITTCTSTTPIISPAANAVIAGASQNQHSVEMVRPGKDFLHLLWSAGAEGECFTKKEVLYFLKEYISSKKLFDPFDPGTVHCGKDVLGEIFGCKKFTINDVLPLMTAHIEPVVQCTQFSKKQKTPAAQEQSRRYVMMHRQQDKSKPNSSTSEAVIGIQPSLTKNMDKENSVDHPSESKNCQVQDGQENNNNKGKSRRKRKREKSGSSKSSSASRARKSSISITYSSDGEGKFPWYYKVQVQTSDENKSEVLSIQGYETAVIQDSDDDLWYMEISSEGGFSVEYEVDSDTSHGTVRLGDNSDSDGFEDIVVVCNDSDIEFWADSSDVESSSESDQSDREISEVDKWRCSECDMVNTPFQRYCDRCWKLRPCWLPDRHSRHNHLLRRSISAPVEMTREEMEQANLNKQQSSITHSLCQDRVESSVRSLFHHSNNTCVKIESRDKRSLSDSGSQAGDFRQGKWIPFTPSSTQTVNSAQEKNESNLEGSKRYKKMNRDAGASNIPDSMQDEEADSDGTIDAIDILKDEEKEPSITPLHHPESGTPDNIGLQDRQDKEEPKCSHVVDLTYDPGPSLMNTAILSGTDAIDGPPERSSLNPAVNGQVNSIVSEGPSIMRTQTTRGSMRTVFSSEREPSISHGIVAVDGPTERSCLKSAVGNQVDSIVKEELMLTQTTQGSIISIFPLEHKHEVRVGKECPKSSDKSTGSGIPDGSHSSGQSATTGSSSGVTSTSLSGERGAGTGPSGAGQPGPSRVRPAVGTEYNDLCVICMSKPKEASIIHGKTGHQVTCYSCAKKLKWSGRPCPICRRPIQKVIKNFLM